MTDQAHRLLKEYELLSLADRARLFRIADNNAFETGLSADELLEFVFDRIKSGKRTWPPDVKAMPFLIMVIKSASDAFRRKERRLARDGNLSYRPGGGRTGFAIYDLNAIPSLDPDPEDEVIRINTKKIIRSLFAQGSVELVILDRMFEGHRGESLRAGLSITAFNAAYRKIARTIQRYRKR